MALLASKNQAAPVVLTCLVFSSQHHLETLAPLV